MYYETIPKLNNLLITSFNKPKQNGTKYLCEQEYYQEAL